MARRIYTPLLQILCEQHHILRLTRCDKGTYVTPCLAASRKQLQLHTGLGVFITTRKLSVESGADKEDGKSKRRWWNFSFESKIVGSIFFAAISWLLSSHVNRKHARKELQLRLITRQIRDLYGPLYGNRLVQMTTYKTVVGEHKNLKNFLKRAKNSKDVEMIRRWRAFVMDVLYPLDKEAEQLICKNAHLVASGVFPEEFELFLRHFAKLQFVMQRWKNEDGKLEKTEEFTPDDFLEETNASGQAGLSEVLLHVEETYRELRKKQKELTIQLNVDHESTFLSSLLMKVTKWR